MGNTQELLSGFDPISLEEMDSVALLNRTDSKYIFSIEQLKEVLKQIERKGYRVLEINGKRGANYRTVYFDTPDLRFYHQHQNGKTNRIKIRCRKYVDSGLCFLEKKFKNNKCRTIKTRKKIEDFVDVIDDKLRKKLKIDPDLELMQSQWNSFERITLANQELKERLTIDLGIKFEVDGKEAQLNNTVICEVKQDGVNHLSPVVRALKNLHIRPMRISKYCIGLVLLKENIKFNKFKEKLLRINRLENELAA